MTWYEYRVGVKITGVVRQSELSVKGNEIAPAIFGNGIFNVTAGKI